MQRRSRVNSPTEPNDRQPAVIVISSEMPELLSLCTRIYAMKGGRIAAELRGADTTQEKLPASAI